MLATRALPKAAAPCSCSVAVRRPAPPRRTHVSVKALETKEEVATSTTSSSKTEAEIATEKYGLEAGLVKALTSKDGKVSRTEQAKQLLAQYGSAYLITSISFAIVSFALCYAAVSSGVDMAALLSSVGLQVSDTSEKVGTFAIAYAAHKALSPVRFPPTVALTPVVAKYLGKKPADKDGQQPGSSSSS